MRPAPVLAALALAAGLAGAAAARDPLALWKIVHGRCAPAAAQGAALPPPCVEVDAKDATAIIKDKVGVAQLLAIPTARVTGIEDPQLLAPGSPNYFAAAWAARGDLRRYLASAPERDGLSITVNSAHARSQDQLHLHIDCTRPDVVEALADYAPYFDGQWRPMTVALAGRKYWARRVDSADLKGVDPFRILADEMPGARGEMGLWSLAAAPLPVSGFVLLADHAELEAGGHAENLQDPDHGCRIAR
jgi:CDP-diacylglycerol pyrophosphatase